MTTRKTTTPARKAATKAPSRKAAAKRQSSKSASNTPDAIALLKADHEHVSSLFTQFDKATSKAKKKQIVAEICEELSVHSQVEEEIFYPAVKKAMKDKELVPEATVEHASVKALIEQVEGEEPEGEMYDAKIKVLCEYVKHHVKEEQEEIFPKAKKTSLDMEELGGMMARRKEHLLGSRA